MSFQYTAFQKAGIFPNGRELTSIARVIGPSATYTIYCFGPSTNEFCRWYPAKGQDFFDASFGATIAAIELCGYEVTDFNGGPVWKPGDRS